MNRAELKELKKRLPNIMAMNEINKVLKKSIGKQYSEGTIKNVLNGTTPNDHIILAAIEVADKHQAKLKEARESLKS